MSILSWRVLRLCCAFVLAGGFCEVAAARADVIESSASFGSTEIELFRGIDDGDLEVIFIPHDSRKATLQVENKTDKPLSVRLPHTFAGVPVLAQPAPGGLFGAGGGGGGAPQAVGGGFPAPGGGGINPLGGIFGGPGGIMNVPAGKVVKVKRSTVCLEHGKPEPGPRVEYRLVPLQTVTDDPAIHELLALVAQIGGDQRIAQIAAWHLANGMSWEQLAGLTIRQANGRHRPRFSPEEIAAAKKLVSVLPSQKSEQAKPSDSLSRR